MRPVQYTITAVDRATDIINRISNRVERLSEPFSRLSSAVRRFGDVSGVNKLSKGIGDLTARATSLLGVILKIGAPLLALFGGGSLMGIYQMTERWAQLGFAASTTSQIIGISTQKLLEWRGVGDLVGISAETMTKGFQGFADTLQDAKWGRNQAVFGMLKMLNIDLKETKNGVIDTESVLYQLADRIQKVQKKDPAAARKLAQSFGVEELLPVLMNGSKAMRGYQSEVKRLQGNLSPDMVNRAGGFALAINKMKIAADGTKASIADKLIPVFQPLIEKWTQWLVLNRTQISDKIAQLAERLAKWLDKIDFNKTLDGIVKFIDGAIKLTEWIDKTVDKFGGWESVIKGVGIALGVGFVANIGLAVAALVGMIGKLGFAAAGVKGLGSVLKWTGGIGAAGAAGWGIGTLIRDQYLKTESGRNFDDWAGKNIARILAFFGNDTAKEALAADQKYGNSSLGPAAKADNMVSKIRPPSAVERAKSFDLFKSLEEKYNLPKGFLDRQWLAESGRGKNMRSPAGATGHFQFMPKTARWMGLSESDTFDLSKSANAATKYMSYLQKRFGTWKYATMAYNWGEGNVDSYIKKGHGIKTKSNPTGAVPQETQDYLRKILGGNDLASNTNNQSAPMNVTVNTVVHPDRSSVTKVSTPQGVKISHNQPGAGFTS